jgi:hypothetical protein
MGSASNARRARVERGIYLQSNGKYAVCCRHAGKLRFRTVGFDLAVARRERQALIAAARRGSVPSSPRLRFATVSGWWLERFEAKVAAGERHRARSRPTATSSTATCYPRSAHAGSPPSRSTTSPTCCSPSGASAARPRPPRARSRRCTASPATRLFDEARHARKIRKLMTASPFAGLLDAMTAAPVGRVFQLR